MALFVEKKRVRIRKYRPFKPLAVIYVGQSPEDRFWRAAGRRVADTEWQDATKELDEAYTELQMPKKKKKPKKEEGKEGEGVPEKWYQKKVGPLKLWHWIAIGGGIAAVIGLWLYLRKK